jgi:hypothetical protein
MNTRGPIQQLSGPGLISDWKNMNHDTMSRIITMVDSVHSVLVGLKKFLAPLWTRLPELVDLKRSHFIFSEDFCSVSELTPSGTTKLTSSTHVRRQRLILDLFCFLRVHLPAPNVDLETQTNIKNKKLCGN